MKKLTVILFILILLTSCKDDPPNNNSNNSSNYYGSWEVSLISDETSTDTISVTQSGAFTGTGFRLIRINGNYLYISNFGGTIGNGGEIIINITYSNIFFNFPTKIIASASSNTLSGNIFFDNNVIGYISGNTNVNSASGSFVSPIFSGIWMVRKIFQ
jgi:hypothetical protein